MRPCVDMYDSPYRCRPTRDFDDMLRAAMARPAH
jgi:hypothetical protein